MLPRAGLRLLATTTTTAAAAARPGLRRKPLTSEMLQLAPAQEIYFAPGMVRFGRLLTFATWSQGIFWTVLTLGTLADFYFKNEQVAFSIKWLEGAKEEKETATTTAAAEEKTGGRTLMWAAGFALGGSLFVSSMQMWAGSIVKRATMQKGWTQMAIETCAIMPKQRKLTINVHEYHTTQPINDPAKPVAAGWLYLHSNSKRFLLDKDAVFNTRASFDESFLRK